MLKFIETKVAAGSREPFSFLQASDTHLTRADSRDNVLKNELAARRASSFPDSEAGYRALLDRPAGELIVHTGDLIDFVSEANLDAAMALSSSHDLFFAAGNHEFSQYVGEAFEDGRYRAQSFAEVEACFRNPIRFAVREKNGVLLVAMDNGYYLLENWQLAALKRAASLGKPILLFLHTPLYEESLAKKAMEEQGNPCAYLMGAPEELLASYPAGRRIQQTPDGVTREACRYILSEPRIKAIFAGHMHYDAECMLTPDLPQFVTDVATFRTVTVE